MIRDILGNLTFGHRMVLYRLLVALFLAGMIYYAFFFPKEGDRALKRAAMAMRNAQSWKVESDQQFPQVQGHLYLLQEVQCPSNYRSTQKQGQAINGVQQEWTNVNMTIGQDYFEYNSKADKWTRSVAGDRGARHLCEALARGDAQSPLPPLTTWARRAFATKGDRRDIGTGYCREWKIAIPRHNMEPERATVCIGEDDDLPRYVTQYDHEVRIFDWNVPLNLQPPQIESRP